MYQILLVMSALVVVFGSWAAEFRDNHVFNQNWSAHARFHCAAYGLTNVGIGIICLVIFTSINFHPPQSPTLVLIGISLLLLVDLTMLGTSVVPGVSAIADGEKVMHSWPISYWMTVVHLGIVLVGMLLYLKEIIQ
ncbi:MAG: hypothetical protein AAGA83_19190 [Cyanobacteria bacterium P01_F01_bin.116]